MSPRNLFRCAAFSLQKATEAFARLWTAADAVHRQCADLVRAALLNPSALVVLPCVGPRLAFASSDASLNPNEVFGVLPRLTRRERESERVTNPLSAVNTDAAQASVVPPASDPEAVEGGSLITEATEVDEYDNEGETVQVDVPTAKPIDPAKAAFLQVLQRAKEGDVKAFEEIFQLYHRRIYNAVYGMLSDPDDAQDVTQDVFMRLHDALPTLRADEAFSTYLYRIALNLCRDRARRKKRVRFQSMDTPRTDDEGDAEPMEFPDQARLPEETLTNEELQRRVREAVQTLSHDHKTVIVMHHFQGMEVNDIARILGVPTGTVKSRLARGRDQLHRKLRGYLNV